MCVLWLAHQVLCAESVRRGLCLPETVHAHKWGLLRSDRPTTNPAVLEQADSASLGESGSSDRRQDSCKGGEDRYVQSGVPVAEGGAQCRVRRED